MRERKWKGSSLLAGFLLFVTNAAAQIREREYDSVADFIINFYGLPTNINLWDPVAFGYFTAFFFMVVVYYMGMELMIKRVPSDTLKKVAGLNTSVTGGGRFSFSKRLFLLAFLAVSSTLTLGVTTFNLAMSSLGILVLTGILGLLLVGFLFIVVGGLTALIFGGRWGTGQIGGQMASIASNNLERARGVADRAMAVGERVPGTGVLRDLGAAIANWAGGLAGAQDIEQRIESVENEIENILEEEDEELGAAREELQEAIEELQEVAELDQDMEQTFEQIHERLQRADQWCRETANYISENQVTFPEENRQVERSANIYLQGGGPNTQLEDYGINNLLRDITDLKESLEDKIDQEEIQEDEEVEEAVEKLLDATEAAVTIFQSLDQIQEDLAILHDNIEEFEEKLEQNMVEDDERWNELMGTAEQEMELDERLRSHFSTVDEEADELITLIENDALPLLERLAGEDDQLLNQMRELVSEDEDLIRVIQNIEEELEDEGLLGYINREMGEYEFQDIVDGTQDIDRHLHQLAGDVEDQESREKQVLENVRELLADITV